MQELNLRSWLVSATGGQIDYVSEDGELLMSCAVPPGRVSAREYLEIAPEGAFLQLHGGLVAINPRSGYGVQAYGPGSHDSGANPDFQPTSASRMEKEMRVMMARVQAATTRLEARERALSSIERVPTAPAPAVDSEPVIETETVPPVVE